MALHEGSDVDVCGSDVRSNGMLQCIGLEGGQVFVDEASVIVEQSQGGAQAVRKVEAPLPVVASDLVSAHTGAGYGTGEAVVGTLCGENAGRAEAECRASGKGQSKQEEGEEEDMGAFPLGHHLDAIRRLQQHQMVCSLLYCLVVLFCFVSFCFGLHTA